MNNTINEVMYKKCIIRTGYGVGKSHGHASYRGNGLGLSRCME
jgi:hypothetical protein